MSSPHEGTPIHIEIVTGDAHTAEHEARRMLVADCVRINARIWPLYEHMIGDDGVAVLAHEFGIQPTDPDFGLHAALAIADRIALQVSVWLQLNLAPSSEELGVIQAFYNIDPTHHFDRPMKEVILGRLQLREKTISPLHKLIPRNDPEFIRLWRQTASSIPRVLH